MQIAAGADDVNEDGSSFQRNYSEIWLGNGASVTHSYTGLRFTNVPLPQGATIVSASLEFYVADEQWIYVEAMIAAEASDTSAPFSTSSRPSQRALTTQQVAHESDEPWLADTWNALDEIGAVIAEVVNRPGWQSGNSLAVILHGVGDQWSRKYVTSANADPALAARLVITYTT